MRSPDDFRLLFDLPPALRLSVLPGRHQPCIHGSVLEIDRDHIVTVDGRERVLVFEQARRFLRVANKDHGKQAIEAVLVYPGGARETVNISVGADVVFSTTAIKPDIGGTDFGDNVVRLAASR